MSEYFNLNNLKSIACDSRTVKEGDTFVVIPTTHALSNAIEAYTKGANCFIADHEIAKSLKEKIHDVEIINVDNARLAFSQVCSILYPNQPKNIVAVTGTNGKSSVVHMVCQFWQYLGIKAASLGTMGLQCTKKLDFKIPTLTTLDAMNFHKTMDSLYTQGITHLAFEASSHGLEQYRCHKAKIIAAGFTNLTQDHLDYHQSMDKYFAAKIKLFTEILEKDKKAVINIGDPYGQILIDKLKNQNIVTYGIQKNADVTILNVINNNYCIQFDLHYQDQHYFKQIFNCIGTFQLENLLCALGLVMACGYDLKDLIPIIPHIKPVKGRIELVGTTPSKANIYVDFAHTPDSLERVLRSIKANISGRIWLVFGCGGNRDQGKRKLMGQIADKLADQVIVTDDNPRFEDPSLIRAQIIQGCKRAIEIGSRREAIQYAVFNLQQGDVLLIAGKGHETGQIIKDKIEDFDDGVEVINCLKNLEDSIF